MCRESDKCGCTSSKVEKKDDCPDKPKADSSKCCGPSSEKQDTSKCTSKCAPKSACAQSQMEKQCSGKSDSGKEKCPPTSKKEKCHSSHEQFKKGKDQCSSACDDGKCNESYTAFIESREDKAKCPRQDGKCHESHSAFFKAEKGPCAAAAAPKQQENPCSYPNPMRDLSENPCTSASERVTVGKRDPCSSATKTTPAETPPCPDQQKQQRCSSSMPSTRPEKPCGSKLEDSTAASTYSKLSGYCKKLAKHYVSLKPKSKCSGDDDLTKQICPQRPSGFPRSKPPCPPTTEIGVPSRVKVDCGTSKPPCPLTKKPDLSAFFPLDARNKELNDCIEKWTKVDPSQVIAKCQQFADKPATLCQKCLDIALKTKHCPPPPTKGMPKKSSPMVPFKARQLAARWTPTAVGYLATSALLTVYVTEWKAVLRHVPFYSQVAQEDVTPP